MEETQRKEFNILLLISEYTTQKILSPCPHDWLDNRVTNFGGDKVMQWAYSSLALVGIGLTNLPKYGMDQSSRPHTFCRPCYNGILLREVLEAQNSP